jgi:hydrogenase large subunit
MGTHITVDPVTRIEGHLRIDAEVDGGVVRQAWSSGQMFRGIERILQGRDPREAWLFTQRFCGVCTTVHAIASVRAVENALGLEVPLNAQYIRNLILAAHAMHDHIVHFYHLSALDWVDVVSALKADPVKTAAIADSLSSWPGNSRHQLQAVQERVKGFVEAGQLGIFANGYWGHPAMKLPPEVNLLAVAHYLEALEYQRKVNQIVAILGSKTPNIQNLAVGGVANAINLDNQATLNMEKLYRIKDILDEVQGFIQQVYFTDVCAVGAMYADWLGYGKGVTNYLSVPDLPLDTKGAQFDFPGGTIMNGDLGSVTEIKTFEEAYFRDNVSECIARSWYDGDWTRHPFEEDTVPKYTKYDGGAKYSWVKAPRFQGRPMQVGPLAQVLVGYALGHKPTVKWANKTLETAGAVAKTKLTPAVLHSTLGRHAARMIRTQVITELAQKH